MRKSFIMLVLLGFALFLGRACDAKSQPLRIVKELDLTRYAGTWHEIARLPNYFERKCTSNVTANYTLRKDGTVEVLNQCETGGEGERAQGVGKPLNPNSKEGHLKVTFAPAFLHMLPFVWADYCVIELDSNYQYALVGEPSRKYLWVLARDKNISQEQYDALMAVAKAQGFDTTKMIRNK